MQPPMVRYYGTTPRGGVFTYNQALILEGLAYFAVEREERRRTTTAKMGECTSVSPAILCHTYNVIVIAGRRTWYDIVSIMTLL